MDNQYYVELIGGDSATDDTSILVNDAPEWARTFELEKHFWKGNPDGVKIVMVSGDGAADGRALLIE